MPDYATFNPPVRPKTSASTATVKTKSNAFGDGYEQVIADGLNAVREELTLTWPALSFAQAAVIRTFFKAQKGAPFLWALPGEVAKKWRCVEWPCTFETGLCSMTAKFTEVFA